MLSGVNQKYYLLCGAAARGAVGFEPSLYGASVHVPAVERRGAGSQMPPGPAGLTPNAQGLIASRWRADRTALGTYLVALRDLLHS